MKSLTVKRMDQTKGRLEIACDAESFQDIEYFFEKFPGEARRVVIHLNLDEIYALARNSLSAASEVVEIKKPGTY